MKSLALTSALLLVLMFAGVSRPANAYVGLSVGVFYNELAPYGQWVDCDYGYGWAPAVAAGWQPYSDGEWIWTDYGWTWVSYDPWPDDPFHYGSWAWDDPWGWVWIPGTVWAPAWVTWYDSDDFIGWAPLPPAFSFTAYGYSGDPVVVPRTDYVFVPSRRFADADVRGVRVPVSRNETFLRRGRAITAFRVAGGVVTNTALPLARVRAAMGRPVPVRSVTVARTDPRPMARDVRGRMSVAAPPSAVRSALAGRPVVSRPSAFHARRGGSRVVLTNRPGGPVRATVNRGPLHDRGAAARAWRGQDGRVYRAEPRRGTVIRNVPEPPNAASWRWSRPDRRVMPRRPVAPPVIERRVRPWSQQVQRFEGPAMRPQPLARRFVRPAPWRAPAPPPRPRPAPWRGRPPG